MTDDADDRDTVPVCLESGVDDWAAYCRALGMDPKSARIADTTRALHSLIVRLDQALSRSTGQG